MLRAALRRVPLPIILLVAALLASPLAAQARFGRDNQPPTTPRSLSVVAATQTSVALDWQASTDNVRVSGYTVYSNGAKVAVTTNTAYTVNGLSCGQTVFLSVDAYDPSGNHSSRASVTASTAACSDFQAPSTPTGVTVSATTADSVTLRWGASTDNVGVAGYTVYRNGSSIGTTGSSSFTATGLGCNASGSFTVDAYDAAGNHSQRSVAVTATTTACSTGGSGGTGFIGDTTIGVSNDGNYAGTAEAFRKMATTSGTIASLNVYVTTLSQAKTLVAGLYADASGHPGQLLSLGSTSLRTSGWVNVPFKWTTTVTSGQQYWIALLSPTGTGTLAFRDRHGGGMSETSSSVTLGTLPFQWTSGATYADAPVSSFGGAQTASTSPPTDVLAPTAPLAVSVSAATSTSVTLGWPASTDNVGVAGYGIYRNGGSVGTTTVTGYTVTGLNCGTTYNFGVDAFDAAGNHSAQTTTTGSTAPCTSPPPPPPADTTAPTVPGGLAVSGVTTTGGALGWTASTDNVGVTGYTAYLDGGKVGTTSSRSYTFSNLACGTSHQVSVDAYDAAGNHSAQASTTLTTTACVTPPPPPPPVPGGASGYVTTTGSDSNPCTQAQPCATLNRAYHAFPGGTVIVGDGTYPSQTISGPSVSSPVTLKAQDWQQVKVAGLAINADNVHTIGIIASGTGESRGSLDVCGSSGSCSTAFSNVIIEGFAGKSAFIRASGVTFEYGEIGGASVCSSSADLGIEDAFRFWGGAAGDETPRNDQLLYSYIHDWNGGNDGTCDGKVSPTPHLDCFQSQGGSHITEKGNVFVNCPSSDNQAEPFSGASIDNWTVTGNYFGQTACCNSIVLGSPSSGSFCSTLQVTGNVMFKSVNQDACSSMPISGNTICSSVLATLCQIPPIPVDPNIY